MTSALVGELESYLSMCASSNYSAFFLSTFSYWSSLMAQMVKNLPAMQKTQIPSLTWEDPMEKEMATHSSVLPGESHGQRSLVSCSS